ncbi:MAG: hypothetical protein EZS28_018309, partial [Streblomastix strix]
MSADFNTLNSISYGLHGAAHSAQHSKIFSAKRFARDAQFSLVPLDLHIGISTALCIYISNGTFVWASRTSLFRWSSGNNVEVCTNKQTIYAVDLEGKEWKWHLLENWKLNLESVAFLTPLDKLPQIDDDFISPLYGTDLNKNNPEFVWDLLLGTKEGRILYTQIARSYVQAHIKTKDPIHIRIPTQSVQPVFTLQIGPQQTSPEEQQCIEQQKQLFLSKPISSIDGFIIADDGGFPRQVVLAATSMTLAEMFRRKDERFFEFARSRQFTQRGINKSGATDIKDSNIRNSIAVQPQLSQSTILNPKSSTITNTNQTQSETILQKDKQRFSVNISSTSSQSSIASQQSTSSITSSQSVGSDAEKIDVGLGVEWNGGSLSIRTQHSRYMKYANKLKMKQQQQQQQKITINSSSSDVELPYTWYAWLGENGVRHPDILCISGCSSRSLSGLSVSPITKQAEGILQQQQIELNKCKILMDDQLQGFGNQLNKSGLSITSQQAKFGNVYVPVGQGYYNAVQSGNRMSTQFNQTQIQKAGISFDLSGAYVSLNAMLSSNLAQSPSKSNFSALQAKQLSNSTSQTTNQQQSQPIGLLTTPCHFIVLYQEKLQKPMYLCVIEDPITKKGYIISKQGIYELRYEHESEKAWIGYLGHAARECENLIRKKNDEKLQADKLLQKKKKKLDEEVMIENEFNVGVGNNQLQQDSNNKKYKRSNDIQQFRMFGEFILSRMPTVTQSIRKSIILINKKFEDKLEYQQNITSSNIIPQLTIDVVRKDPRLLDVLINVDRAVHVALGTQFDTFMEAIMNPLYSQEIQSLKERNASKRAEQIRQFNQNKEQNNSIIRNNSSSSLTNELYDSPNTASQQIATSSPFVKLSLDEELAERCAAVGSVLAPLCLELGLADKAVELWA